MACYNLKRNLINEKELKSHLYQSFILNVGRKRKCNGWILRKCRLKNKVFLFSWKLLTCEIMFFTDRKDLSNNERLTKFYRKSKHCFQAPWVKIQTTCSKNWCKQVHYSKKTSHDCLHMSKCGLHTMEWKQNSYNRMKKRAIIGRKITANKCAINHSKVLLFWKSLEKFHGWYNFLFKL